MVTTCQARYKYGLLAVILHLLRLGKPVAIFLLGLCCSFVDLCYML